MRFKIRPFHLSDLSALYRICLLTAKSGKDATSLYSDPDLVGSYYAAPYAIFEPEVCFVITNSGNPCGYIIGTKDTEKLIKTCEKNWFPILRERYKRPDPEEKSADAQIRRLIHEGYNLKSELTDYPAHLHIDLLPIAQGQGLGRKIMNTFIDNLKKFNTPALHLEVGKTNTNAIKFYQHIGFHIIKEYENSIAFGMQLR